VQRHRGHTLKHEFGNDTVKGRVLIAISILPGRQLSEIPSSFGHYIVVEPEYDTINWSAVILGRDNVVLRPIACADYELMHTISARLLKMRSE
jgi:hypothetical protein